MIIFMGQPELLLLSFCCVALRSSFGNYYHQCHKHHYTYQSFSKPQCTDPWCLGMTSDNRYCFQSLEQL